MAEAERKTTPRTRKAAAGEPKASSEGKPTAKRVARRSGAVASLGKAKVPAVQKAPGKPRVQGRKGGSQKVHTPVEAPDSVRSVARAKLLFALGEGEWAGTLNGRRIFLDGTPLIAVDGTENFPGVRWDFRPGTQHQEYIPGLPAVENETSVGVELRSDTPWVRSLTNPELSAARVRLSWPALQQQLSNGDVVGYRIDYAIDLAVNGGAWQEVLTATLNDKTTSKYERSHRIDLPESSEGWSLRVRRLTPNSQKNTVSDTMRIEAITEVIDAKLRYPNTALLYIEFDSSQFQNIPKVSCEPDMRIVRVPSNYDPASRTYTGIWDGIFKWAFTDNPAWVLYDLILNKRFGLGRRLDMTKVDRWELYEIARYCDELVSDGKGGQEPRFTCNVYIQSRADAWTVIRDIAAIFRGISYWSGSEMVFQADKPSDVEYVFSRSNVIDGKFQYTGQSERTRYSSALVSWDNPDNAYESEPEPVSIPALIRRYNFNQTEITAIGCTRQSEAHRRGRWLLLTNSVDRGVTFSTGLEGYLPKPGRIIGVADALLAGRQLGGRISGASGRQVTLDRNTQIKAGDRLIVNLPSGKAEARTVQAVNGRTVTVTADFSEPPRAQAQWGIESADLVIQQYRVTKVSRSGSTFEISGVMNDPGKYDQVDSGTRLEPRPISVVPARTQQAPEGVKLSSYTRTVQGLAVTTLRAEWQAAPGAIAYTAEWRKDSGAWIAAPRSSALGFDVPGIYAGRYMVRVRAINPLEVASLPAYSDETVLNGKEGAPPALASFTASPLVFAIGLAWTFPPGADDTRYIEVQQNKVNQAEGATLLGLFPYPQRGYEITGLAPGATKFLRARLVDTTGNEGPWTDWVFGQASAAAVDYLNVITEDIVKGALGQELFTEIDKISGTGVDSVNGRIQAAKQELESLINNLTDPLEYMATKAYAKDDSVRKGQRVYTAIAAVPAAANGSNGPPNATYWVDIGSISSTVNGLAQSVTKNTTDIGTIDGKLTVNAAMLQAVQSASRDDNVDGALNDALLGWSTLAQASEEMRTRATQNEAVATRLVVVESRVDDSDARARSLERTVATNESATASRLTEVSTKVAGHTASLSQLESAVTDNESSTASRLQLVNARIDGTNLALDKEKLDRDNAVTGERQAREAAVENEATARVNGDKAISLLVETVSAQVGENTSKLQTVEQAQVDTNQALTSLRTNVEAVYTTGRDDSVEGDLAAAIKGWESTAKLAEESKTRATAIDAQAKKTETLEVSFNSGLDKANGEIGKTNTEVQKTSAALQVTSQALAALDGAVSTLWSVKMEVHSSGKYVLAGVGLAIENGKSQMVVLADQFAVASSLNGEIRTFFAVQNGASFMDSAFIMDGSITNAKIGSYISSTDYVAGQMGWILNKSGTFEINGTVAGQGRLLINNQRLRIYHANGNLAIDLGVSI